jgi:hypothetical protein
MNEQDATPAPAPAVEQPEAPKITVEETAADKAVEAGDIGSFREAKRAERTGKPLPVEPVKAPELVVEASDKAPEATNKPAAPAQPERTLSKKQQEANERIQRAIEQAHADLLAENARLRAQMAPRRVEQPDQPASAPTEPEFKRYLALPDAPKLDQFDSIEEHAAAMAYFISSKVSQEREQRAHRQATERQFVERQGERTRTFQSRIDEVRKTDPEFWDGISEPVRTLRPRADLRPHERPTAANDLADEILDSEQGPRLMKHLSEHPDVFERLVRAPSKQQLFIELGKLYSTFEQPPAAPPTKTISSAPAPVTVLGSKAAEPANAIDSAVADNDVARFRAQRMQARLAGQRR